MNKLLPFALALALALPGCAAGDTVPQPPEDTHHHHRDRRRGPGREHPARSCGPPAPNEL